MDSLDDSVFGCHLKYETRRRILSDICVYTHAPNYAIITFRRVWRKRNLSYRGADKSLARPGRKQAWKHVMDAHGINNTETRAVIKFVFLQGKAL